MSNYLNIFRYTIFYTDETFERHEKISDNQNVYIEKIINNKEISWIMFERTNKMKLCKTILSYNIGVGNTRITYNIKTLLFCHIFEFKPDTRNIKLLIEF
jgi:hypothetical protein